MTCCSINVRIAFAILGISAGLMAGLDFAFAYKIWSATGFAFISAIFAALCLYLHLAYKKNWLEDWRPSTFSILVYTNALLFILSFAAMIACLFYAGFNHQGLGHDDLMKENYWMTAVWTFMTAKWTAQTAWWARVYSSELMRPLTHTPPIY